MAEYIIQGSTLEDIADAIREQRGITDKILPRAMSSQIRAIQSTAGSDSEYHGVPDYVVTEAKSVANRALSRPGTLRFIAMSDMHNPSIGDISDFSNNETLLKQYQTSNAHAGTAAKIIADIINPDFIAHLGDFGWISDNTTMVNGVSSIVQAKGFISDLENNYKTLCTPGNHDVKTSDGYIPYNVVAGLIGTYSYYDIISKKIRIICLNTADNSSTNSNNYVSYEQLNWFAETLCMEDKSDANDWKIVLLSHHPLDWGNQLVANCLYAYNNEKVFNGNCDYKDINIDFTGKKKAQIIAQFHGHVHGFRVDYIREFVTDSSSPTITTIKRIAIPNACYGRNNEYGNNGKTDSNNIEFGYETTYLKDANKANDTAFCVVTIDVQDKKIYADCYGAGIDRVVDYGENEQEVEPNIKYDITQNLTYISSSNTSSTIYEGATYTTALTAHNGYVIDSVTVTMGGENITSTAYNDGIITIDSVSGDITITAVATEDPDAKPVYTITTNLSHALIEEGETSVEAGSTYSTTIVPEDGYSLDVVTVVMGGQDVTSTVYNEGVITINGVTGNIEITATAERINVSYTNLVTTSEALDGTVPYGTNGYKNGVYASGTSPFDGADTNTVTTGWIQYDPLNTLPIYIKGATLDLANSHTRIHFYSLGKTKADIQCQGVPPADTNSIPYYFDIETIKADYYKLTPITDQSGTVLNTTQGGLAYVRFSLVGTGENLIITINEPIE